MDFCTLASTALNRPTPPDNGNQSIRGLEAVTLILLIASALSSTFVLRHSKLVRRDHLTAIAVATQLLAWISKAPLRFGLPTDHLDRIQTTCRPSPLAHTPAAVATRLHSSVSRPLVPLRLV